MKALLIDPESKPPISYVDFDGSLQNAYDLLDCSCVQQIWFRTIFPPLDRADRHLVLVDEEAALRTFQIGETRGCFRIDPDKVLRDIETNGGFLGKGLVVREEDCDWSEPVITDLELAMMTTISEVTRRA